MFRIRKGLKCSLCAVLSVFILFTAVLRPVVKAEAAAIAGGIALEKILETLIISAGVTYLGVELGSDAVNNIKSDSEAYQSLKTSILSGSVVSGALADALSWSQTYGSSALDDDYVYESSSGFRVTNGGNSGGSLNAAINVGLAAKLIQAAKDAAKEWADSNSNEYYNSYFDSSISSSIGGLYPKTVNYSTEICSAYGSIDDIDTFYALSGCADYLHGQGYNDGNSYVVSFKYAPSSRVSDVYFFVIPLGCTFLFGNSYSKSTLCSYCENSAIKNFFSVAGQKSRSDCYNYLGSSVNYFEDSEVPRIYVQNGSSISSSNDSSFYSSYVSDVVLFNFDSASESGSFVRTLNVSSDSLITIKDYTFNTLSNYLKYDITKAPNYRDVWDPSNGYVEYGIPENMITGGSFASLGEMVEYANSLCAALNEWQESQDKNHDEDIEQGNDILDAINQAVKGISGVSDLIGDIAASILELPLSIAENIQAKIIEIFPDSVSVGEAILNLPDIITSLPNTIADGIQDRIIEIFPDSVSVGDAIIELPDIVRGLPDAIRDKFDDITIEVPEIKIPEISIPEINVPPIEVPDVDVELNPNYEITVQNDYTGLSDIISNAVEGALTELFVPDEVTTLDKIDDIEEYFEFKDELKPKIGFFAEEIANITPCPYLKIPLGTVKSKYDYGLGDFWIIDCSWYSNYKDYGDKIILCLFWLVIVWNLFMKIPGIISGADATVSGVYHSWYNALDKKGPKRIEGKKG